MKCAWKKIRFLPLFLSAVLLSLLVTSWFLKPVISASFTTLCISDEPITSQKIPFTYGSSNEEKSKETFQVTTSCSNFQNPKSGKYFAIIDKGISFLEKENSPKFRFATFFPFKKFTDCTPARAPPFV
ncbi:MAG: hypothetical protein O9301_06480 [Leptospira sp.]|nr:hypothetical protein [Leptospira sp.]